MLSALRRTVRNRALTAADTWERHLLVAELAGAPKTVIDVGGMPGQLSSFLPDASVVAANITPPADLLVEPGELPFKDASIDVVCSLDALEHVPREDRQGFVSELVRVARRRVVLCCPLGTPEHVAAERDIQAWHRAATGADHPWLTEHLQLGLPTAEEVRGLLDAAVRDGDRVRLLYHGDFRVTDQQFRLIVAARRRLASRALLRFARRRLLHRPDLRLSETPGRYTNRVFALVDREAASAAA